MTPRVFILATCRNPDLFGATTLVFNSLRVGFPTAKITVFDNANSELHRSEIRALCQKNKCDFVHLPDQTIHHVWIESLMTAAMDSLNADPFWFCDTDVVFWDSVEGFNFVNRGDTTGAPLAGRLIPSFFDEFSQCQTEERLHTSLLRVDPSLLRDKIHAWHYQHENSIDTGFVPPVNLFYPVMLPHRRFFDTCAMLYSLVGGEAFGRFDLDRYDHLHAGTISDIVGPCLNDGKMQERHAAYIANPETMRGLWRKQDEFFAANSVES